MKRRWAVWSVLAAVGAVTVVLGLCTGPGRPLTRADHAVPPLPTLPASTASLAASAIVGSVEARGNVLTALTDALVIVPAYPSERVLELSGSEVRGVGPSVTVTFLRNQGRAIAWYGLVGQDEGIVATIPVGTTVLVSFTNDLATASQDRNLTLRVVGG